MRYQKSTLEAPVVLGELPTGGVVTIVCYRLSDSVAVALTSNACTEIGTTGLYKWAAANITVQPVVFTEYAYVMSDGTNEFKGKFVLSGYPDEVDAIKLKTDNLPAAPANDATVAKEATLNTKIPTALSFTGANVNAESKVTAAPTDMALNSTVAKEATLNTKIPTALSFTGANVNAESKVTAAPTDMALNSTVAKDATVAKEATLAAVDATVLLIDAVTSSTLSITNEILDYLENKLVIDEASSEWWLYDDTGTVIIKKWPLKDKSGAKVSLNPGAITHRGTRIL